MTTTPSALIVYSLKPFYLSTLLRIIIKIKIRKNNPSEETQKYFPTGSRKLTHAAPHPTRCIMADLVRGFACSLKNRHRKYSGIARCRAPHTRSTTSVDECGNLVVKFEERRPVCACVFVGSKTAACIIIVFKYHSSDCAEYVILYSDAKRPKLRTTMGVCVRRQSFTHVYGYLMTNNWIKILSSVTFS